VRWADAGAAGAPVGAALDVVAARPRADLSAVEAWFHCYDGQPDHAFFHNYVPNANNSFEDVDVARATDDLASYEASVARSRAAVAARDLGETSPGEDYSLRWIYLHVIEEYGRHNGHADLLREQIDGVTGE
jgi:hypothetical protein